MKTLRTLLLLILFQPVLASGLLQANQPNSSRRGAKNSDEYLKREVRNELMSVPWYSVFDIIQYNISGNEVTLTGAVTQPTVKTDAENAVKHIEGVEKVNDKIEVLPPSPMDDQIRRAEYRAIYSQESLFRYGVGALQSIHIIVNGGRVTLEGFVDNEGDKNVAGIAAKGVPNVFSVANNLVVNGGK